MGGKSKVNCSYFITPPGHCAFVPVALHSRYISLVGCISTAKNLDANLFLIPFAETLGARHDDIRLDKSLCYHL